MITCSACGQTNEADARFCTRCDRPLDWDRKRGAEQPSSAVAAVLNSRTIEVKPGQDAACELRVRNLGTVVDQFRFEVSGPLSGWCTVEPAVLPLFPKASGTAQLVFRLPRSPEARAGPSRFEVTASSTVDSSARDTVAGTARVAAFEALSAALAPQVSQAVNGAEHVLKVQNLGNAPVRLTLSASDPEEALRLELAPDATALDPGEATAARLRVTGRGRETRGDGKRHPFQVLVQPSAGEKLTLDGATVLLPRPPSWFRRHWLVTAAAAALIVLLPTLALLLRAILFPSPSVSLSRQSVAPGDSLVVKGQHLPPGQVGIVQIASSDEDLGPFRADARGTFEVAVTIPADVTGRHLIKACYQSSCPAAQPLMVAPPVLPPAPETASPTASSAPTTAPSAAPTTPTSSAASSTPIPAPEPRPAAPAPTPSTSASGSTSTSGTSSTASSPTPDTHCRTSQLDVKVDHSEAAAGHQYVTFQITNGGDSCSISGFVGLQLVDVTGKAVPTTVFQDGGPFQGELPPSTVSLGHGRTASFMVHFTSVPTGAEVCAEGEQLWVTPPGETEVRAVSIPIAPCNGGELDLTPVRP